MAVPKKKTSKSRRDMRRAHDAISAPGTCVCPECKEVKQPHRICAGCGTYKGKTIIETKEV